MTYRTSWTQEEDKVLKEFAGKKTAVEIAGILGRTKNGVHHRMRFLGLDGRMTGENHWNARISNLQAAVIGALYESGFTVNEIHRIITNKQEISLSHVNNICSCRSRRAR